MRKNRKEDITDAKVMGRGEIRHFVIGGHPGKEALGDKSQVEYYEGVLTNIMGWSGLSSDETGEAIKASPDTIENSESPNYKSLYLQALGNICVAQESK